MKACAWDNGTVLHGRAHGSARFCFTISIFSLRRTKGYVTLLDVTLRYFTLRYVLRFATLLTALLEFTTAEALIIEGMPFVGDQFHGCDDEKYTFVP